MRMGIKKKKNLKSEGKIMQRHEKREAKKSRNEGEQIDKAESIDRYVDKQTEQKIAD